MQIVLNGFEVLLLSIVVQCAASPKSTATHMHAKHRAKHLKADGRSFLKGMWHQQPQTNLILITQAAPTTTTTTTTATSAPTSTITTSSPTTSTITTTANRVDGRKRRPAYPRKFRESAQDPKLVNEKLDIEELRSELVVDYAEETAGDKLVAEKRSKQPQSPAVLAAAITTTAPIGTESDDLNPIFVESSNNRTSSQRPGIWQALGERWREHRRKRKNPTKPPNNNSDVVKQQVQLDMIGNENGMIHMKKKRKPAQNKNKKKPQMLSHGGVGVVASENNTNSPLQNIINAFRRRTPVVYNRYH